MLWLHDDINFIQSRAASSGERFGTPFEAALCIWTEKIASKAKFYGHFSDD